MSSPISAGIMEYDESDIGVNLLESITLGLYRFPFNAVREYIQNEADSRPRPDRIDIKISGRDVFIVGDGSGMNWNDILEAKKVGISPKDPETDAGFRGIGIFSGIAVCREVIVETRKRKSDERIILRMNGDGLRKEILSNSNMPLLQALRDHVSYERHKAEREDKFFGTAVHLREILSEHLDLLDLEKLRQYLELTAPADFSTKFAYREKVNHFLERYVPEYRNFKIILNGEEINRRPLLSKEKLREPREYVYKKGKDVKAVWWVCPSSQRSIDDPADRNFIYKCKGLTVGARDALNSLIETNKNLLEWMVGEIHVLDPKIKPNTERVAFEPSSARDELEHWIRQQWSKEVKEIPRQISAENVATKRLTESEKMIRQSFVELDADDKWIDYLTNLKKLAEDVERDSKDQHLLGSFREKAGDRGRKLSYHRKKAQEAYNEWKRSQLKIETLEPPQETSTPRAPPDEGKLPETALEIRTAAESEFEFRPNDELLDKIDPVVRDMISRLELPQTQGLVVKAAVVALSTWSNVTEGFLRDFLLRLEYAIKES